jgi:spermidine synthase
MTHQENWQSSNLNAIKQRLEWIRSARQGCFFVQQSGNQYIKVAKNQSTITLGFSDDFNSPPNLIQSELDLDKPLNLKSPYTQAMMLSLAWNSTPQKIYIAGLGGGIIPLFLHHYFPEAVIDCAEIDPAVFQVATTFFGVKFDQRLNVAIQDGREYLAQQNSNIKYDIILSDVFLGTGYTPYRLATQEFYELCQQRLSQEGVVVVNLFHNDDFFAEKLLTIQSVFEQVYVVFLTEIGNRVIIANNGNKLNKKEIMARAKLLQNHYQLEFPLADRALGVKMGEQLQESVPKLKKVRVLVDDFPPADYFGNLPFFNPAITRAGESRFCMCGSGKLQDDCHGKLTPVFQQDAEPLPSSYSHSQVESGNKVPEVESPVVQDKKYLKGS